MTLEQARIYLAKVLPWPQPGDPEAWIGIHHVEQNNGRPQWRGKPCASVQEAVRAVDYALRQPNTTAVYACLSSQREYEERVSTRTGGAYKVAKRSTENAVRLKSLFLDIDIGKGGDSYATGAEAAAGLADFLKVTGLPKPSMIVASGGGMHVYFTVAEALTPAEWKPLAFALAEAAKQHGLKCDRQVTVDAARVLRVAGTFNLKTGTKRPVRIAGKPTDFDYSVDRLRHALLPYIFPLPQTGGMAVDPAAFPPRPAITTPSALSAGIVTTMPAEEIRSCLDAIPNDRVDWNWWNSIGMRVYAACEGADYGLTEWERWSAANPVAGAKESCRERWDTLHSSPPTRTGAGALVNEARRVTGDAAWTPLAFRPTPVPKKADDLPPNYTRNDEGVVFVSTPGDDGTAETKAVCDYPMTNPWMQRDPWVLHFTTKLLTGEETTIAVTTEELGEQGGSTRALHKAALVLHANQKTAMQEFLVSWVQKLQQTKDAVVSSAPFGWFAEHGKTVGFIYGGRLWRSDGTNAPAANPDPVVARQYAPAGDRQRWCDAYDLIGNQEHAPLDAIVATAFAAPLVMFTGHEGLLMCAYSTESGIGKTTALKVAQGVWGSPIDAKQGLKDTELSVFKKLGEIKSLPLYWDELKSEADTKRFVDIVFALSSGREKTRLTQSTALRAAGTWQTLMMSCSNESIIDYVVGHTKQTTAGLYRVFEYVVPPNTDGKGRIGKAEAQRILAGMNGNYGSIGLEYAKWLGTNIALVSTDMAVLQTALEEELVPSDDERYWMSIVACVLLGARYANELGFTRFDLDQLKKFMLTVLTGMRGERLRQPIDMKASFDVGNILAQFLGAMRARNTLYTDRIHIGAGKPHKGTVKIVRDVSRLEDLKVHVGVDDQLVRISNSGLAKWLKDTGQARGVFMRALEEQFGANTQLKATLGGGTDYNSMQQYITEIQLADHSEINFLKEE